MTIRSLGHMRGGGWSTWRREFVKWWLPVAGGARAGRAVRDAMSRSPLLAPGYGRYLACPHKTGRGLHSLMHDEKVLLESRSLRDSLAARTDALDKVRALELLPDGLHVTTPMVAAYFEVAETVVNNLLERHREEMESNGLQVLRGAELREFVNLNVRFTNDKFQQSYPQNLRRLALYTRRTVLNVAMLLRDSAVARRVRAYLLDAEESTRLPRHESPALERRVTNTEAAIADIGPALRDLGHLIHRMSVRLESTERRVERVDRRLENTERVVCAMSERLADVAADLKDLRDRPGPTPPRRRHRGQR
jgi:hypothetical protein